MTLSSFDALQVGDAIPVLELPPVSRLTLALYCGASGDHNPIHVDSDFARSAGMPDVFAHGMLSMAWLGRLLTDWVPDTDQVQPGLPPADQHHRQRAAAVGELHRSPERGTPEALEELDPGDGRDRRAGIGHRGRRARTRRTAVRQRTRKRRLDARDAAVHAVGVARRAPHPSLEEALLNCWSPRRWTATASC